MVLLMKFNIIYFIPYGKKKIVSETPNLQIYIFQWLVVAIIALSDLYCGLWGKKTLLYVIKLHLLQPVFLFIEIVVSSNKKQ